MGWFNANDNGNGTDSALTGSLTVTSGVDVGTYSLFPNPTDPNPTNSPSGQFFYDDILYPNQDPLLSTAGLLFTGHGLEINIWGNGPGTLYSFWSSPGGGYNLTSDSVVFTLNSVPEGGTLSLLGGVCMMGAGVLFRRRRTSG